MEFYVKECNVCLASKAIRYKLYNDFQSLPILIHWWKNLSIDIVTGLFISTNWKIEAYDLILVIVNRLTKIIYHKSIKVLIDAPGLVKVIINTVIKYHGLPDFIIND